MGYDVDQSVLKIHAFLNTNIKETIVGNKSTSSYTSNKIINLTLPDSIYLVEKRFSHTSLIIYYVSIIIKHVVIFF